MPNFSRNEVVLVSYPFSDLTAAKIPPAVIVGAFERCPDHIIVPLTSRTSRLAAGEFSLADWQGAGLNVPSVVKRGIYTVHASLIRRSIGRLVDHDARQVEHSLRNWLDLT